MRARTVPFIVAACVAMTLAMVAASRSKAATSPTSASAVPCQEAKTKRLSVIDADCFQKLRVLRSCGGQMLLRTQSVANGQPPVPFKDIACSGAPRVVPDRENAKVYRIDGCSYGERRDGWVISCPSSSSGPAHPVPITDEELASCIREVEVVLK